MKMKEFSKSFVGVANAQPTVPMPARVVNPRMNHRDDDWLNESQKLHLDGELDIYKPIESYQEEWIHEVDEDGMFVKAYPIEGTRVKRDLPPLVNQWKYDYKRRHGNGKSTSDR